jgi:hypothetical protein
VDGELLFFAALLLEAEQKPLSLKDNRGDDTKVRNLSGSRSCGDARALSNSSIRAEKRFSNGGFRADVVSTRIRG